MAETGKSKNPAGNTEKQRFAQEASGFANGFLPDAEVRGALARISRL